MLKKKTTRILTCLALLILLSAVIFQYVAGQQDTLSVLQKGDSKIVSFEELNGAYPAYKLSDAQGVSLGYGVLTSASGYGGPLDVLSIVGSDGVILSVTLIENYETPVYLRKVLDHGLLEVIKSHTVQDGVTTVDVISGATVTSNAIKTAVQKGVAQIAATQFDYHHPKDSGIRLTWQEGALILLVLAAVVCAATRRTKIRPWLLLASVLLTGFALNASLTYSNYVSLLAGNLPAFPERPLWYLMVPGILIITLVWGRNFYCYWLCPFGAVQEAIYRSLNLMKVSFSPGIQTLVSSWRWPILWLFAIGALLSRNPGIASYEPFSVFFDGSGNTAQWVMTIVVVLFSIVQARFWCKHFCPIGAVLDLTARAKGKLKRRSETTTGTTTETTTEMGEKQANFADSVPVTKTTPAQDSSSICSRGCSACGEVTPKMTTSDKVYMGFILLIDGLIIVALLQNLGVL